LVAFLVVENAIALLTAEYVGFSAHSPIAITMETAWADYSV
jgi:hypothetical protein